ELVEALVELRELEEAEAVVARLGQLAERADHPWGLASVERCRASIGLARAEYDAAAAAAADRAAAALDALGLRFDRARTLLASGRAHRRHRKWARARALLEEAAATFEAIGATGWAADAHAELERVAARPPHRGLLTPAEQRVAELAAAGLANKEIAAALFVSI